MELAMRIWYHKDKMANGADGTSYYSMVELADCERGTGIGNG